MADTLDILTLPEGHTAINLDVANTSHDTELAQFITAISRIMDTEVGPVVQRTVTAEIHTATGGAVWLRQWPVVSISLLREAVGGTISTLSAVAFGATDDGYFHDTAINGRLFRRSGSTDSGFDNGNQVEVTYVAGRYANTAAVDARYKACAASILRRLWKRESGTWAQSSDFFEQIDSTDSVGLGFYRVAKPIIDEMLSDQLRPPAVA